MKDIVIVLIFLRRGADYSSEKCFFQNIYQIPVNVPETVRLSTECICYVIFGLEHVAFPRFMDSKNESMD